MGAPAFLYHVEGQGPFIPDGASLLQLSNDASMISWSPVGTAVVGSIAPSLRTLCHKIKASGRSLPVQRKPAQPVNSSVLNAALLMGGVQALRPQDSIIVTEAPSSLFALRDHIPIIREDGFFTGASGGLGYGLPAAVGIALARPGERIVAILGDGSAMYGIQGLWSAARIRAPMTFIIVKNGKYSALIDIAHRFGIQQTVGTSIDGLDFVALAAGHGLPAASVSDPHQLDDRLREAFAADEPTLLEVVVD